MKYSVDKIEGNIVVIQDIETGKIIEVSKDNMPDDICESDMLVFNGNNYEKNEEETKSRAEMLREKMNRLKKEQ